MIIYEILNGICILDEQDRPIFKLASKAQQFELFFKSIYLSKFKSDQKLDKLLYQCMFTNVGSMLLNVQYIQHISHLIKVKFKE